MADPDAPRITLTIPTLPPRVLGPDAQPADFLEVDTTAEPGSTFVRAEIEGGEMEQRWVVMGQRRPDGRPFEDLWLSPDASRAHFRVRPRQGSVQPGPGQVRVIFAGADGAPHVAAAPFEVDPDGTLRLPSGAATSPPSFYSGPSGPAHERVVDAAGGLRVGRRWDDVSATTGVTSVWQPLAFEVWLDDTLPGRGTGPPDVEVAAGRVHAAWDPGLRSAQLTYDPRDEAGRVQAGRHAVRIAWRVRRWLRSTTLSLGVAVEVGADGTVRLVRAS